MTNNDFLQRFIFENAPVRGEFIQLNESFQAIVNQHAYPEPIRRILGEALCVAGLLSAIIKFSGRLTVQFRGNGKLKMLLAQCDNEFNMRGLVKWDGEMSYDELMESFHHGVLVIMLDSVKNTNRYQGIVSWSGSSLAESIEGYFRDSEQLATRLWLSVNEAQAVGLLLQVIPNSDRDSIGIEHAVIDPNWNQVINMTSGLTKDDLLKHDFNGLMKLLYPHEDIRLFPAVNVAFKCTCSRKRGEDAIGLLGREEAEAELKDKQVIVVTCDFCNQEYVFDPIEVANIFENRDNPPTNTHLH